MRRIAIVYSGATVWGGIETYLCRLFDSYDKSRLKLDLISIGTWELTTRVSAAVAEKEATGSSDKTVYGQCDGSTIILLPGNRLRIRTIFDIAAYLKRSRADLVVSQGVVANAYARMAALISRVPSLVVVHSDLAGDYPNGLKRMAFIVIERTLRGVTKRYVTVSRYLKESLVSRGVRPEMIVVVYNGVDLGRPAGRGGTERPPEEGSPGIDSETPPCTPAGGDPHAGTRVVSVGRLHKVKNFESLIAAMSSLPASVSLEIWGEGVEKGNLDALIDKLGLGDRARLAGRAESVVKVISEADVYVQSSWSEGFGLAVVEAMLCKKPVVVTPCGSLPELVEDGATGIVAADSSPEALAAAIAKVAFDGEFASRLAEAGCESARKRFSTDAWLDEITAAFLEAAH